MDLQHEPPSESGHPVAAPVGLILGPAVFIGLLVLLPAGSEGGLTGSGRVVCAAAAWMAVWWLTEAVPLAVTALLPLVIFPLGGVGSMRQAAAPYADEVIFLFMGGFVLGKSLEHSGLHRRLALWSVRVIGSSPARMIGGMMLATALISMFVSNTATAMMMTPIALSIATLVDARAAAPGGAWSARDAGNFACAMLLGVAYASSIGGMGTIIGTPPNMVFNGFVERELGTTIGFTQWMIVAMPVVLVLLPASWFMLLAMHPVRARGIEGGREFVASELRALGPMRRAEWMVLIVFVCAVVLWIFRQPVCTATGLVVTGKDGRAAALLSDAGIAILAALVLLIVPVGLRPRTTVITWRQAERLPWGILLLFGGGLSLAWAIDQSGLDDVIGRQFGSLAGLPGWAVLLIVIAVMTFVGELSSNTAAATAAMPILTAAGRGMGLEPIPLLMGAVLACSLGFMLPVATPPNAIVYATGRVPSSRMLRAGLALDVLGILVIWGVLVLAGPWLMRLAGIPGVR